MRKSVPLRSRPSGLQRYLSFRRNGQKHEQGFKGTASEPHFGHVEKGERLNKDILSAATGLPLRENLQEAFGDFCAAVSANGNRLQLMLGVMGVDYPTTTTMLHPAFFFDDEVKGAELAASYDAGEVLSPFPNYWLVYQTDNGALGKIENVMHVAHDGGKLVVNFFLRMDKKVTALGAQAVWQPAFRVETDDIGEAWLRKQQQAVQEAIPELISCVQLINERQTDEGVISPAAARAMNRATCWRGKQAKFLSVGRSLRDRHALGGTHRSPVGHQRCGHKRRYKSGREVWIKPTDVNGGSPVARDYRVSALSSTAA